MQVKPQLEKLLNLPRDSLTKEIELMQDLMDLVRGRGRGWGWVALHRAGGGTGSDMTAPPPPCVRRSSSSSRSLRTC